MSMPPRQQRLASAVDALNPDPTVPTGPSFEDRALQALAHSRDSVKNWKLGRIPQPGNWAYVPVLGPAWEGAADLQDGNYAGALFNGAMLAADLSPVAPYLKAVKLLNRIHQMKRTVLLARAGTQTRRVRAIENAARKAANNMEEYEVHHTIPMGGLGPIPAASREAEGLWRNHPFNLKILPTEIHDAVHNGFGNPYTDPFLKMWHGTNALQKGAAAFTAATAADAVENRAPPSGTPNQPVSRR